MYPPAQTIMVDRERVEGVENLTYLGSQLSSVDGSRTEQRRRMGIAASTMQRISCVWSVSHLTLTTRLCLYMSLVVPVLLYASETWNTTGSDLARLQAFHMRCQRLIIGVHWYEHVTNIAVACRTNLPHIGALIAAKIYSFFGHVVRQSPDVPSNMALKMCREMSISRRIPPTWKRP